MNSSTDGQYMLKCKIISGNKIADKYRDNGVLSGKIQDYKSCMIKCELDGLDFHQLAIIRLVAHQIITDLILSSFKKLDKKFKGVNSF